MSIPATTQANRAALAKSAAGAAIIKAVHGRPNGNGSMGMMDRNKFVREVLHVRCRPSPLWLFIHFSLSFFSWFDPIDRSIVRGSTLDGIPCAGVACVGTLVYLPWRTCCLSAFLPPSLLTLLPNPRALCVATRYQCPCIVARCITPTLTCIDIRCSSLTLMGVSVPRVNVSYCGRTSVFAYGLDVHDDKSSPLIADLLLLPS